MISHIGKWKWGRVQPFLAFGAGSAGETASISGAEWLSIGSSLDLVYYSCYSKVMAMNIHEAKTHFSKLLERVAAGEDIVISRAGVPVAVVLNIHRYKVKRELGFARGAFQMADLEKFNGPLDHEILQYFTGESD